MAEPRWLAPDGDEDENAQREELAAASEAVVDAGDSKKGGGKPGKAPKPPKPPKPPPSPVLAFSEVFPTSDATRVNVTGRAVGRRPFTPTCMYKTPPLAARFMPFRRRCLAVYT